MDTQNEGRLALASYSLKNDQISSGRQAAKLYNVSRTTLQARKNGRQSRKEAAIKSKLLLPHEEAELINWIGSMQRRGFPPFLINIEEMAYALRLRRGLTRPIGQKWL
jgi:hypothetical protein